MSDVQIFHSPLNGASIEIIYQGEQPVFSVPDLAKALEYSDTSRAVKHLPIKHIVKTPNRRLGRSEGGHDVPFTTEAGLYRLIMRSNMPKAVDFQDWVTDELLPTIRKEGGYIRKDATDEQVEELKRKHQLQLEGMSRRIKQHEYLVNKEATLLDNERRERISDLEGQVALESAYGRYVEDYVGAYGTTKDMMTKAKFKKERFS